MKKLTNLFIAGTMFAFTACGGGSADACDCIDHMSDAMLGGSYDDETKYLKCIEQYYDEAFDYMEANEPNLKFQDYESVVQHYWIIKCDESKS